LIDDLSMKISLYLKEKYPQEMPSISIMKYSIKFLISNIIPLLIIMVLAIIFSKGTEVMTAVLGFSALRIVSGGYHLKSATYCIVVSTIMIFAISSLSSFIGKYNILLLCLSLLLILVFAPSNIAKMTRIKEQNYYVFKIIALLIVSSNLIFQNEILTTSYFIQSLLLINLKGGVKNAKKNYE